MNENYESLRNVCKIKKGYNIYAVELTLLLNVSTFWIKFSMQTFFKIKTRTYFGLRIQILLRLKQTKTEVLSKYFPSIFPHILNKNVNKIMTISTQSHFSTSIKVVNRKRIKKSNKNLYTHKHGSDSCSLQLVRLTESFLLATL